jgi:hypothetical protein
MRMVRRTILVATAAAVIAGSAAAAANADMMMTVGAPTLGGRVLITVPLTITCSPFDPSLTPISAGAFVSVEQASGQSIAQGFGSVGGSMGFPQIAYSCDGTPQKVPVLVQANPSGPPFHGGPASFTISAGANAGLPCSFFPGCFTDVVGQGASFGPAILNVH